MHSPTCTACAVIPHSVTWKTLDKTTYHNNFHTHIHTHTASLRLANRQRWQVLMRPPSPTPFAKVPFYGYQYKRPVAYTYMHTTILQSLYRSICVGRHLQLRTGGFWCSTPLLTATSNYCIWIREKTPDFSSAVLLTPSPYHTDLKQRCTKIQALKKLDRLHHCSFT